MEKKFIDYMLVPLGVFVMMAYHLWLLYRIVKQPTKTVIGLNAINRRFWVQAMMEDVSKNGVLAVQSLRNNIMASTLLASTAIMLSSLIAILMTSGNQTQSAAIFIFGDRSQLCFSMKFFCILVCFLTSFLMNVQSVRYYSHASILINVPFRKMSPNPSYHILTAEYVAIIVNKGSYFWSLGLRAFYFSFPLFLWIFGPIPMSLSCFVLVLMLYFLDVTFEVGWAVGVIDNDEKHHRDEELGGAN
ncbi:DUF599 domain-containing protein [Quillaja saponaria]|uniref:DUF599 domain-containing protein n=1 Tax=Quillaja saponaria TaxID=32244 RepID=A0AAD7LVU8_QUISA|nr:DUF599 domain-containing protein [Quillaja saponaria]